MAEQINDNYQLEANKSLDNKYLFNGNRVYSDASEAISKIVLPYRHPGLTVLLTDGTPTEYWWRDGVTDEDLILKAPSNAFGWQATLLINPDLNQDNLIDGGYNDFTFQKSSRFQFLVGADLGFNLGPGQAGYSNLVLSYSEGSSLTVGDTILNMTDGNVTIDTPQVTLTQYANSDPSQVLSTDVDGNVVLVPTSGTPLTVTGADNIPVIDDVNKITFFTGLSVTDAGGGYAIVSTDGTPDLQAVTDIGRRTSNNIEIRESTDTSTISSNAQNLLAIDGCSIGGSVTTSLISGSGHNVTGTRVIVGGSANGVTGNDCFVTGNNNTVTANYNIVNGVNNVSNGANSFVQGSSNTNNSTSSCVIGQEITNGADWTFIGGSNNTVTGGFTSAIFGRDSTLTNPDSCINFGIDNHQDLGTCRGSVMLGLSNHTSDDGFGVNLNDGNVALGSGCITSGKGSVALGYGAKTRHIGEVAFSADSLVGAGSRQFVIAQLSGASADSFDFSFRIGNNFEGSNYHLYNNTLYIITTKLITAISTSPGVDYAYYEGTTVIKVIGSTATIISGASLTRIAGGGAFAAGVAGYTTGFNTDGYGLNELFLTATGLLVNGVGTASLQITNLTYS